MVSFACKLYEKTACLQDFMQNICKDKETLLKYLVPKKLNKNFKDAVIS